MATWKAGPITQIRNSTSADRCPARPPDRCHARPPGRCSTRPAARSMPSPSASPASLITWQAGPMTQIRNSTSPGRCPARPPGRCPLSATCARSMLNSACGQIDAQSIGQPRELDHLAGIAPVLINVPFQNRHSPPSNTRQIPINHDSRHTIQKHFLFVAMPTPDTMETLPHNRG